MTPSRFEQIERICQAALKLGPKERSAYLAGACGNDVELRREVEALLVHAMLRAKKGDRKGAEANITEAIRVGKNFWHFQHTAYSIGTVYSVLGDFDNAQEWIENASNDGFPCYVMFETDPHLAQLRTVPKFQAFLKKLRQEWEHIPGEAD